MSEAKGFNGESIVFDGATVAKFKHHGKAAVAALVAEVQAAISA